MQPGVPGGDELRLEDGKRRAVQALKELNFHIVASGDSYNDTTMLGAADGGILFQPPQNVIDEFPQYPVARNYDDLRRLFIAASNGEIKDD